MTEENSIVKSKGHNGGGHPLAFETPEKFRDAINKYFTDCNEQGKAPTHLGIAVHLGVSRRTLNEYTRREGYAEIHEEAKERLEEQLIQKLENKAYATAGLIFNLTNNYGWKQPNQIEHSGSIAVAHSQVPPDVQNEIDSHRAEIEGE